MCKTDRFSIHFHREEKQKKAATQHAIHLPTIILPGPIIGGIGPGPIMGMGIRGPPGPMGGPPGPGGIPPGGPPGPLGPLLSESKELK